MNKGIEDSPDHAISIPKAVEILRTGDYTSLLKDRQSGRTLAALFDDERGREGYLLAFLPGAGLPPGRALEPAIAALLIRIAERAAGLREPFSVRTAASMELSLGVPLEALPASSPSDGFGVVDAQVSRLETGTRSPHSPAPPPVVRRESGREWDLSPVLVMLALVVVAVEWFRHPRRG